MSTKDECTFRFSNFLIIGLCSSPANSWFDMISFLTEPIEAELAKDFDRESKGDFL